MTQDSSQPNAKGVVCTEHVRMNAIAGLLFLFAGDGIILYSVMRESEMDLGSIVSVLFGTAGVMLGLYYLFTFVNRRIMVTDDGVTYVSWLGKKTHCSWYEVEVSYHLGRNAQFIFMLKGKRVKFYGYDVNAQALFDYLFDHERFDNDTLNAIRDARAKERDRVRTMQKKARENAYDWGEDSDEDDAAEYAFDEDEGENDKSDDA